MQEENMQENTAETTAENNTLQKACDAFKMKNAEDAWNHLCEKRYEILQDYGDEAYGHRLYAWDDGHRMLAKCKSCGGYLLIQRSEYHGMEDDSYYTDYFPVESEEDADFLNREYDGFALEAKAGRRYLQADIGSVPKWSWVEKEEEEPKKEPDRKKGSIFQKIFKKK